MRNEPTSPNGDEVLQLMAAHRPAFPTGFPLPSCRDLLELRYREQAGPQVLCPVRVTPGPGVPEVRRGLGITDTLVRLSVGLEHVEDLWLDLQNALAAARAVAR